MEEKAAWIKRKGAKGRLLLECSVLLISLATLEIFLAITGVIERGGNSHEEDRICIGGQR